MPEKPNITIEIPTEGLRSVVHQYVMEQLDTEQRSTIVAQAISYLLTPQTAAYGRPATSPLEDAFNNAVGIAMNQIAREIVAEDPGVRTQLYNLMGESIRKWLNEDAYEYKRNSFVAQMGEAIGRAMSSRDD